MKSLARCLAILALAVPLFAAAKTFKDTSDYRDTKAVKGYLNVKFDTYAHMLDSPKGTDCDWVMADPTFNLEEVRKQPVTFFPDSISRTGGWDASYWGMYSGFYGIGLASSFESAVRSMGINLLHASGGAQTAITPAQARANMMAAAYGIPAPQAGAQAAPQTPDAPKDAPAMSEIQKQIEMDRYTEDKKNLGVEEAAKRAEEREAKRVSDWQAKAAASGAAAKEAARPKSPEEMSGYVLVLYITESKVNTASVFIPFMPVTNTTTGEFILLRDGKPVLAGRHNSVGAYTGSAPKCGNALATAFGVKVAAN